MQLTTFNTLKSALLEAPILHYHTLPSATWYTQMPQMMPVELNCQRNMMVKNFQLHSFPTPSWTVNENGALWNKKPMVFTMLSPSTNNKVNRQSLDLATYHITCEWMSGAHNKTADCLSWLVDIKDTPTIPTVSINMLVTSNPDGPPTHTNSTTCNAANTTPLVDSTTAWSIDKVNAPPPLTENRKDTLRLM